jgi:hypothetical protein
MNLIAIQATELSRAELAGFLFFAVIIFIWGCCVFANPKPPKHP